MCRESAQFAAVFDRLGCEMLNQLEMVPREAFSFPLPFFGESLARLSRRFIETGEYWVRDIVGEKSQQEEVSVSLSSPGRWPELAGHYERWLQTMHDILDDLPDEAMELSIVLPTNVREELGNETTQLRHCLLHVAVLQASILGRIQAICQLMADGERTIEMVFQGQELLS